MCLKKKHNVIFNLVFGMKFKFKFYLLQPKNLEAACKISNRVFCMLKHTLGYAGNQRKRKGRRSNQNAAENTNR